MDVFYISNKVSAVIGVKPKPRSGILVLKGP